MSVVWDRWHIVVQVLIFFSCWNQDEVWHAAFPFMYLGDVPNVFSVHAGMAQNYCPPWMDDWKTNHGKISGIRDRLWNVDTSFAVYWTWLIASPGTKANESNDKWGGAPHGWRDARKGQGWGQLLLSSVWQVLFENDRCTLAILL